MLSGLYSNVEATSGLAYKVRARSEREDSQRLTTPFTVDDAVQLEPTETELRYSVQSFQNQSKVRLSFASLPIRRVFYGCSHFSHSKAQRKSEATTPLLKDCFASGRNTFDDSTYKRRNGGCVLPVVTWHPLAPSTKIIVRCRRSGSEDSVLSDCKCQEWH